MLKGSNKTRHRSSIPIASIEKACTKYKERLKLNRFCKCTIEYKTKEWVFWETIITQK